MRRPFIFVTATVFMMCCAGAAQPRTKGLVLAQDPNAAIDVIVQYRANDSESSPQRLMQRAVRYNRVIKDNQAETAGRLVTRRWRR